MLPLLMLLLSCVAQLARSARATDGRDDHHHAPSTTTLAPPGSLRVDGLAAADAVVSEARPMFSFAHGGTALLPRGATQAAYRITVSATGATATASSSPPLHWDSGSVSSDSCSEIPYGGPALRPFALYTWSAEWQASDGQRSARATSTFETGPMAAADWHGASWLSGGTQLRTTFDLPAGPAVSRARAFVAAPGCHALLVNGAVPQPDLRGVCPWVAGGHSTHPDYARDRTNVRYMTHDITSLLNTTSDRATSGTSSSGGANALGLLSGHVMIVDNHTNADVDKTKDPVFGSPLVMALIMVEFQGDHHAPLFLATTQAAGKHKKTGAFSRFPFPYIVVPSLSWQIV